MCVFFSSHFPLLLKYWIGAYGLRSGSNISVAFSISGLLSGCKNGRFELLSLIQVKKDCVRVCECGPHATPYIKLKNAYAWIHLVQCINIQMSKKRTKMSKHPEMSGPKGAQNLLWEHEKLISFARQILVWQCVGMLCATILKCVCVCVMVVNTKIIPMNFRYVLAFSSFNWSFFFALLLTFHDSRLYPNACRTYYPIHLRKSVCETFTHTMI